MSTFLFEKEVDQSLLKSGLTVPISMHGKIQEAIGVQLSKGERTNITILLDGNSYAAVLTNVNFSEQQSGRVVFQIRYSESSALCQKLKALFSDIHFADSHSKRYIEVFSLGDRVLEFRVKNNMKEAFLKYLGPVDSLAGYQRSYKLVFYKVFFSRLLTGQDTTCDSISSDFRNYYIERKKAGFLPDIDADSVIANVETSSNAQVLNLILRNPFSAISSHGFMSKEPGKEDRFVLSPDLMSQLSSKDIESIIQIVDKKLNKYFFSVDKDNVRSGYMREIIKKMLNDYVPAKREIFAGHPLGAYFRNDIPRNIYDTGLVDSKNYLVTGSVGQGNWAMVPWVCIFDRSITTSATKGVYIVYLLEKSGQSLYLTFNQGCTEIRSSHSKRETIQIMRKKAAEIIERIDSRGFRSDEDINLGDGLTELGELYQKGTIFYKEYRRDAIPEEAELQDDLAKMMGIYREYADGYLANSIKHEKQYDEPARTEGEEELTIKETISRIKAYIEAKGFSYQEGLIENFYLSLKSKPFVILAGTSGTGKTRLVKLFAEAVGANTGNGRYKMVSVRPDWSDSSDLFGHVDLNGKFVPGAIIDFVKRAELDSTHPYFLCLDEMNLARVEYYLSDFLSVIETRDFQAGHIVSEPLVSGTYYGSDNAAAGRYGTVPFPENLYVIGTVNMDETTFPFSRKVLDRANTIEFSFVDLTPPAEWAAGSPAPLILGNDFLKTEYLLLAQCAEEQEAINAYCLELQRLNRILQQANAHVGYRVRDEVVFYLLNNKTADLLPENEAIDIEIRQKILPRIQGSSASIKNMLCELFRVCARL